VKLYVGGRPTFFTFFSVVAHVFLEHCRRLCMCLSPSCIIWYRSRGGDALAGKVTRSGVALFKGFIHLQAHGLRKGDDHPAYTPHGVYIGCQ